MAEVFISYAHVDNLPLSDGLKGWISEFHNVLEVRLRQLLGESDVKIWRDPKLDGNDVFGESILEALRQAKVLVSVVSPRYVKSDWCKREVNTFCESAEKRGCLHINHKSSVMKVVKFPVPASEVQLGAPAAGLFEKVLGYDFFVTNAETGRPQELDGVFGQENTQGFSRQSL